MELDRFNLIRKRYGKLASWATWSPQDDLEDARSGIRDLSIFDPQNSTNVIRDLHTDTSPAPHTGTPIFNVTLIAEIPSTIRVHELKEDFETFCATEDLDGALEASKG